MGDVMRVFPSRRLVDPLHLEPEDIELHDIAHALARQCRYNGHVGGFLSVARHAIWVAELLLEAGHPPYIALHGLHHDDAEAYLGDMISPLKHRQEMWRFRDAELFAEVVIWEALGLPTALPVEVTHADRRAGELEQAFRRDDWDGTPQDDEDDFILTHQLLMEWTNA